MPTTLQDLASVTTGNDFVKPTPWKAEEHAQICRENFAAIQVALNALEALVPSTTAAATLLKTTVSINNTATKALPTTPQTIIAAPGSGKRIVPVHIDLFGNFSVGAYTNVTNDNSYLTFKLGSFEYSGYLVGAVEQSLGDFATFFGNAGKSQATIPPRWQPADLAWGTIAFGDNSGTGLINQPLTLFMSTNGNGDLTGGNAANTLKVRVLYMVETD